MSAQLPEGLAGTVRTHQVIGAGGVRLAVAEVGPPDAPAWLIAHGAGSSARFVATAFAAPVLAAGARLVTYDLRGHGASAPVTLPADHHLDAQVADLVAVAERLGGPIGVVGGVSLGAHAAVRAVASGAVDVEVALACLPAWTGSSVPGSGPHAAIADEVDRDGVDGVLARLHTTEDVPGWLRHTLTTDYARHDPASLGAGLRALDGGDAPEANELVSFPVPLAVLGWDDDPGHPLEVARRWSELAPRGELHQLALRDLEEGLEVLGRRAVEAVISVMRRSTG